MTITGGTNFGGGNAQMTTPDTFCNSQGQVYWQQNIDANTIIKIVKGDEAIKNYTTPKNINYVYYTSSDADSTYQFSFTSSSGTTTTGKTGNDANKQNNNDYNNNDFNQRDKDFKKSDNNDNNDNDIDDGTENLGKYINICIYYLFISIFSFIL